MLFLFLVYLKEILSGLKRLLFFLLLVLSIPAQSQDSLAGEVNPARLRLVLITEGTVYAGTMIGLNSLWYQGQERSSFHFFNDSEEWLQMDKAGHAFTAYHVGRLGMETLRWSGVRERQAIWYGGSLGFFFLLSIEALDGFSAAWGASSADLISNAAGTALLIGQELAFKDQPLTMKFSYAPGKYPSYRPETLGENWYQEIIKDYNGQTYWASLNLHAAGILPGRPHWLNVAFGYGASGMTGGTMNPAVNDAGQAIPEFQRYRQYYLSLDVDLSRIRTRSKWLRTVLRTLNFVKVPFPALELNSKDGLRFHTIYY